LKSGVKPPGGLVVICVVWFSSHGNTAQLHLAVYVLVAEEEKGTASIAVDVLDIARRHVKLCVLPLYPVAWLGQEPGDGVPLSVIPITWLRPQDFVHWHFDDLLCELRANFFCGREKKRKWVEWEVPPSLFSCCFAEEQVIEHRLLD
jgi:hypothetical protein